MKAGTSHRARVLVYRLGSLGDTVVALPALHLLRRTYPDSDIRALTNFPVDAKGPAMGVVIGDSGLVNGYFRYPVGTRSPRQILRLALEIRAWRPAVAVYLAAPRGRRAAMRDIAFLRICGARTVIGTPLDDDGQRYRRDRGQWESEAARLARCLRALGDAEVDAADSWDLALTDGERAAGMAALGPLARRRFFVVSVGGKTDVQDWGEDNWAQVLDDLLSTHSDIGLLAVGAADERARCTRLLSGWRGPSVNICGRVPPRVAAAAMAHGAAFAGHDSGPLHMAAAVGLPCVGVFSSRALKGVWFPNGPQHTPLYTDIECAGCQRTVCEERGKACILAIPPATVAAAIRGKLGTVPQHDLAVAS